MPDASEKTKCYTYKVEMVIQILAKDLTASAEKLNSVGGHVTSRKVELLDTTDLPIGSDKPELDKRLKPVL
jgi:hypothetical protein